MKNTMNNANEYQKAAHAFASYGLNPTYAILGLAEECGEVAGKFAKYIRHYRGNEPLSGSLDGIPDEFASVELKFRESLANELGDVLWMVAEICTNYNITLSEVMADNLAKLNDRRKRGVIDGSGDNR